MTRFTGVSVQGGLSVGPIHFLHRASLSSEKRSQLSPREEQLRFEAAKDRAITELRRLEARIAAHLGSDEAAIFLFQSTMLEDADYLDVIRSYINASATAEYAVEQTEKAVIEFFASLDSSYLRARAADARDLSRRLTGILSDHPAGGGMRQHPAILVAEELSPSEAALLDSGLLLGLVSQEGTSDSHIAILSHAIGVPSVIGIPVDPKWEGHTAILDGDSGTLIIDPDEQALAAARPHAAHDFDPTPPELTVLRKSGERELRLCASIDSAWEAVDAYRIGASRIAMYRTDILHGGRATQPSEDEQLAEYRHTIEAMHGRSVAFQMLRFRSSDTLSLSPQPDLVEPFRTQLRAILRASVASDAPVTILLTGVRTTADFRWVRRQLRRCRRELEAEGHGFHDVRIGSVVDSPVAVYFAGVLSLASETLVIDGEALMQSTIYSHEGQHLPNYHALGWMLRRVLLAGHRCGCTVIMSGELEQFPQAIHALVELGFDALAVPVRSLLPLHAMLSGSDEPPLSGSDEPPLSGSDEPPRA